MSRARPVSLPPGAPVRLSGPYDAVVLESGVIALMDGLELRRGTMIGPVGADPPDVVATTRTQTRLWQLPAVAGLPMLLGAAPSQVAEAAAATVRGGPPTSGVHPPADYPPLAAPPGPPPPGDADDRVDRRFERRLWWLVLLLLLFALLISGGNLMPGPAWAEMPTDRALLRAERGTVEVRTAGGRLLTLRDGAAAYVAEGDRIEVADRSAGELVFRGGAATVLCAWVEAEVGPLRSDGTRPVAPSGELTLDRGRILADTASVSGAFRPLAMTVISQDAVLANRGEAWFAVNAGTARVSLGEVRRNGVSLRATGEQLGCGDGRVVDPPGGTPSAPAPGATSGSPTVQSPSPDLSATSQPTPAPAPNPGVTRQPQPQPTTPAAPPSPPGPPPTSAPPPTTAAPTTDPPTSSPTRTPPPTSEPPPTTEPPPNEPPTIFWEVQPQGRITQLVNNEPCSDHPTSVRWMVVVSDDAPDGLTVVARQSGPVEKTETFSGAGTHSGSVGPVASRQGAGGIVTITVTVTDSGGLSRQVESKVEVVDCGNEPGVVT